MTTLASMYELTCHLVHLNGQFLSQFCDSVEIIAHDLLIHFLSNGTFSRNIHAITFLTKSHIFSQLPIIQWTFAWLGQFLHFCVVPYKNCRKMLGSLRTLYSIRESIWLIYYQATVSYWSNAISSNNCRPFVWTWIRCYFIVCVLLSFFFFFLQDKSMYASACNWSLQLCCTRECMDKWCSWYAGDVDQRFQPCR